MRDWAMESWIEQSEIRSCTNEIQGLDYNFIPSMEKGQQQTAKAVRHVFEHKSCDGCFF